MADIIRYVNPLSAGGDGTTTALSGANSAYASLNAGLIAEVTDLVTAQDRMIFECFGAAEDTVDIDWPAFISNATYPIIARNATGESGGDPSKDQWDTGSYRLNPTFSAGGNTLRFFDGDVRNCGGIYFEGIQLGIVANGSSNYYMIQSSQSPAYNGAIISFDKGCVFNVSGNCTGSWIRVFAGNFNTVNYRVRNCVWLLDASYTGTAAVEPGLAEGSNVTFYGVNNTIKGLDGPLRQGSSATVTLGNTLFANQGGTSDTSGTITSLGGNTTSEADFGSMTSTGNSVSQVYTFESNKATLASADSGAAENGVDLSADPTLPVNDDAFAIARPQNTLYDAGYHERVTATRIATPQESSDIPGGVITFDLTGFTGAPTAATVDGVSVSISNATINGVDVTLPSLSDFVLGGSHATTQFNVNVDVVISEGVEDTTAQIQIDEPDNGGPDYFYGVVTDPSGDSVFPAEAAAPDEYLIERVSGTGLNIQTNGSISAGSPAYEVNARVFDISAGSWSAVNNVVFEPSLIPVDGVIDSYGDSISLVVSLVLYNDSYIPSYGEGVSLVPVSVILTIQDGYIDSYDEGITLLDSFWLVSPPTSRIITFR